MVFAFNFLSCIIAVISHRVSAGVVSKYQSVTNKSLAPAHYKYSALGTSRNGGGGGGGIIIDIYVDYRTRLLEACTGH